MKQFSISLCLMLSVVCKGQDSLLYQVFPVIEKKVVYEKVIEAPGQSKDTLFLKAKMWALSAFKSQKAAFQTEDKEGGLIAYNTFFKNNFTSPPILGVSMKQDWEYWSQIRIYLKDGKAKVVIENDNLTISNSTNASYTGKFDLFTFKTDTDELYKKSMTSKKYRERFWESSLTNFKEADLKYKKIITALEEIIKSNKRSEADF